MDKKAGGYEAHMTFDKQHHRIVEDHAPLFGMVFSVISGCPLLGPGTYCYLTGYDKEHPELLVAKMDKASQVLNDCSVPTLRMKVEHIVYDTKTGVNEI